MFARGLIGTVATVTTSALIAINTPDVANAFQVFNNRQEWEAALSGSPTTFDFSDIAGESVPSGTVLPNGLAVSYAQGVIGSNPGFFGSVNNIGTRLIFGGREPFPTPLNLNLNLPSPVEAIGFDLSQVGGSLDRVSLGILIRENPTTSTSFLNPIPVSAPSFFGFIPDENTAFNNVFINCISLSCSGISGVAVSNISVLPKTESVPEPSSAFSLVLLSCLGGIALLKYRKKPLLSSEELLN